MKLENKRHFYWLDLMRFIAAFQVMAGHFRGAFFVEFGLLPMSQQNSVMALFFFITRLGEESVMVFFVLSGFLVGGRSLSKILSNQVNIKQYAIDRLVRIMLPLPASVLLVFAIYFTIGLKIPWEDILGSLFSLQGVFTNCYINAPIWSLAYEVWFYILMFAIMILCRSKNSRIKLMALLLLSVVFLVFTKLDPIFLFVWFIGAFIYLLPPANSNRPYLWFLILLIIFVAMIFLSQITSASNSKMPGAISLNRGIVHILLALITSLFIHTIIELVPQSKLAKAIDGIGSKLAKFSYSLYMTHYPLIYLLNYCGFTKRDRIDFSSSFQYLISIFIGLIIGYLVYLVSEKHTYKVKQLINNRFSVAPLQ